MLLERQNIWFGKQRQKVGFRGPIFTPVDLTRFALMLQLAQTSLNLVPRDPSSFHGDFILEVDQVAHRGSLSTARTQTMRVL